MGAHNGHPLGGGEVKGLAQQWGQGVVAPDSLPGALFLALSGGTAQGSPNLSQPQAPFEGKQFCPRMILG